MIGQWNLYSRHKWRAQVIKSLNGPFLCLEAYWVYGSSQTFVYTIFCWPSCHCLLLFYVFCWPSCRFLLLLVFSVQLLIISWCCLCFLLIVLSLTVAAYVFCWPSCRCLLLLIGKVITAFCHDHGFRAQMSDNLGVVQDGVSLPPPELIPPVHYFSSWLFEVCFLV